MMKVRHIYAVEVRLKAVPGDYRISQQAYATYDEAIRFIAGRSDQPLYIHAFLFESEEYSYIIHDLEVKEEKLDSRKKGRVEVANNRQ